MKVSDFILDFLVAQGVDTVFGIQGGMISPLFDAFHGRKDIKYVCTQHEQAAAMAADSYARFKGLGVAIATSGPGATNLITGIGCSYFDSIPILCITGNVNTREQRGNSGIRQRGFQETDIVSIVKPITKYAQQILFPGRIQLELETAINRAKGGRPGPALMDVPIDVLMADYEPNTRLSLLNESYPEPHVDISADVAKVVQLIAEAKRPVVIYGNGARHARAELLQFIEMTGIPCLPSWAALDMIPHDHPLYVSTFGVYGHRAGNLAVQNADLLIAIGTRLDTRMTGAQGFAPNAKKVIVDIDSHEAMKTKADVLIFADALDFLEVINKEIPYAGINLIAWHKIVETHQKWLIHIAAWKQKYPIVSTPNGDRIQPLDFVHQLCATLPDGAIVVSDSGANLSWTHQAFEIRGTQRLFSAYGYSPMGYSLPAAIGAHYATGKPIVAIMGDGAAQMNIQEWQTLKHYNIPIKAFILNNKSYGIIKQFQEELYDGRYEATDENSGYSVPNFRTVAEAYGLRAETIYNSHHVANIIERILAYPGPVIVDVEIDPAARIFPKTRYGDPLEHQFPYLPDDEQAENMRNE